MSRPNLHSVAVAVAVAAICLCSVAAAADQNPLVPDDGGSAQVVNGVTTGFHPAVGALLIGDAENGRAWCTGTLIGCRTFITAAHCVCPSNGTMCTTVAPPDPGAYTVFFQHAGILPVSEIVVHPAYEFPRADLAILTLAQPVAGVRPIPINREASPRVETVGTIVGFGSSGGGKNDFGIRRSGRVVVAADMVGKGDGLLGWYFRGPMGEPGSNANTCSGDSGGPLLLAAHDGWMLAGTTTGGQNGTCLTDDVSVDTDVFAYHEWVDQIAGSDLSTAPCGDGVPLDDESVGLISWDDGLDEERPQSVHRVVVPRSSDILRVMLNGVDDGRTAFSLDVRAPDATAHCRQNGRSQFAVCEVPNPAPGIWEIRVERRAGSGPYQLNAVVTPGDGPHACTPAPRTECTRSGSLHRPLLQRPAPDIRQSAFTWRWTQAQRGVAIDYGDPTASTNYAFCLYDDGGRLLLNAALAPGSGWSSYRRGFRYQSDQARGGGISHARLRSATRNRVAILVKGRGLNPIARVSRGNRNVRVQAQLQGENGCWETMQMLASDSGSQ